MATKYMHTIDGRPALWSGEQIVFVSRSGAVKLENSLAVIRRHQRETEGFRLQRRLDHNSDLYGYVRVRITNKTGTNDVTT